MSDPLTALMYAVQVMNFLKTLIIKTLREREECLVETGPMLQLEPSDEDGHHYSILKPMNDLKAVELSEEDEVDFAKEPLSNQISSSTSDQAESRTGNETNGFLTSIENILSQGKGDDNNPADDTLHSLGTMKNEGLEGGNTAAGNRRTQARSLRTKIGQASKRNDDKKGSRKHIPQPDVRADEIAEKKKDLNIISSVNSHEENVEAWR